ncbi:MAG: tRNA (adenosine(37)-N6)-threonylcarbamoyltransferase complex ATPase subunit type 1 TsaE [Pseudomonadota bacterium]
MKNKIYKNLKLPELNLLAAEIAQQLESGSIVTLFGELGAGKTTFAATLINALTEEKTEVLSPTFNIMQPYEVKLHNGKIETLWHLDLYRLKNIREADELGLDEVFSHIAIIEWAEIIEDILPKNRIAIKLEFNDSDDERNVYVKFC